MVLSVSAYGSMEGKNTYYITYFRLLHNVPMPSSHVATLTNHDLAQVQISLDNM